MTGWHELLGEEDLDCEVLVFVVGDCHIIAKSVPFVRIVHRFLSVGKDTDIFHTGVHCHIGFVEFKGRRRLGKGWFIRGSIFLWTSSPVVEVVLHGSKMS